MKLYNLSFCFLAVAVFAACGLIIASEGFDHVDEKIMTLAADVVGSDGYSYKTTDSNNRQIASMSLLDSFESRYRYLALYHAPVVTGKHFRFDVHLAGSNDLKKWRHIRELIFNADMPRIVRVWDRARSTNILAVVHEQWGGPPPESNLPSQLGIKLYLGEKQLLKGEAFSEVVLPLSSFAVDSIEGTPSFYKPFIEISSEGTIVFSSEILFHYFSSAAGRDQQARGLLEKLDGSTYERWSAKPWNKLNQLMDEQGVVGNVGQRSVMYTGHDDAPSMLLEANIGGFTIDHGQSEWADWRIFYLKFPQQGLFSKTPPAIRMIEPKTHKKSVSFGNPSWTVLRAPDGDGLILAFNYFLFSEGTVDRSEERSLVFYHKLEEKDFDEDGLDDLWEHKHTGGLSFFNKQNKTDDFNKNGLSAREESVRGLNPFVKVEK